jgi:hypothetical protein
VRVCLWGIAYLMLAAAGAPAGAQEIPRKIEKTALCSDQNCKKGAAEYRPWELKLSLPPTLGQCTTYRTTPFFAVILTRNIPDTAELDCDEVQKDRGADRGEQARQKALGIFPGHTVFLRMLCVSFGDYVQYSIPGEGMMRNFLAVYARDRATAERIAYGARRFYPVPQIVSMTARVAHGDDKCQP